jgi:hypothetical protein
VAADVGLLVLRLQAEAAVAAEAARRVVAEVLMFELLRLLLRERELVCEVLVREVVRVLRGAVGLGGG